MFYTLNRHTLQLNMLLERVLCSDERRFAWVRSDALEKRRQSHATDSALADQPVTRWVVIWAADETGEKSTDKDCA